MDKERAIGHIDWMETYRKYCGELRRHSEVLAAAYALSINGRAEEAADLVSGIRIMGKPFADLGEMELGYLVERLCTTE